MHETIYLLFYAHQIMKFISFGLTNIFACNNSMFNKFKGNTLSLLLILSGMISTIKTLNGLISKIKTLMV